MRERSDYLSLRLRLFLALSTVDRPVAEVEEKSTIDRIVSLSEIERNRPATPNWVAIVAKLLAPREIDQNALETQNFSGRFAIEQYLGWLEGRPVRSSDELLDKDAGQLLGTEDGRRKEVYQNIIDFLDQASGKPVLVVHQEAMQDGMTALAARLCQHLAKRSEPDLAFVYLPLHPHGSPGVQERVTLPKLVAWLKAFYEGENLGTATVTTSPQDMRAHIAAIRKAMTERPVIIILDGHRSPGRRLPYLHAAMIDDPLLPLLEELIHPRHAANLPPPDPAIVGRSRILVLSDQDIDHHAAFRHNSITFPLPAGKTLDDLCPDVPAPMRKVLKQARSCCSDVGLHLFSRMATRLPPDQLPTSIEGLYEKYCVDLEREDRGAMAVLYLIALTYDGLRSVTLQRLLDHMQACHALQSLPLPWRDLDKFNVGAALHRLQEDRVVELVVDASSRAEAAGQDDAPEVVYDLVASSLRQAIVGRLARRDKDSLVLAHRLIAEEALRQHTDQLARSDWLDRFDTRSRRRLYQFFYHAFLSLDEGPGGRIARLDAVPHVLPATNEETYRRLYAVFFRTLTEGPAALELSRVLGRDGLKSDLLTMALRAGSPSFTREVLDRSNPWTAELLGPFATRYDWSPRTSAQVIEAMVNEMRRSRARAEFSLRRHPLPRPPTWSGTDDTFGAAARLKLTLDLEIEEASETAQYRSVIISAGDALEATELTRDRQSAIDHLASRVALPSFVTDVDTMVGQWASNCQDSARLAVWSDLLCRIGEARQLLAELGGTSSESAPMLTEAFVSFFVAERLRRASFDVGPLGNDYIVNGRSTRVFVRICLQLLLARQLKSGGDIPASFLIEQADRHIGIVTRYFARFPSEASAIHVLRAQRERIVGHGNRAALDKARRWLELADEMMWYARDRQTVRMMLLLERCAVYRSLARITAEDDQARFREAAKADAVHLDWMSKQLSLKIWTRAATHTFERLNKLNTDLSERPI